MNHNSFFPWTTSSLAFNPPTHGLVTTTPDDPWTNFRLAKKKCCPKSWKLGNCWVFCPPFWLAKLWASSRCFTKKLLLLMKTNPIENTQAKFANSSTRVFSHMLSHTWSDIWSSTRIWHLDPDSETRSRAAHQSVSLREIGMESHRKWLVVFSISQDSWLLFFF